MVDLEWEKNPMMGLALGGGGWMVACDAEESMCCSLGVLLGENCSMSSCVVPMSCWFCKEARVEASGKSSAGLFLGSVGRSRVDRSGGGSEAGVCCGKALLCSADGAVRSSG